MLLQNVTAVALLASSLAAAAGDDALLVGQWKLDAKGPNQITWTFNADHTLSQRRFIEKEWWPDEEVVVFTGTWQLEGTTSTILKMKFTRVEQGPVSDARWLVDIAKDRLRMFPDGQAGAIAEYVRVE